jgi:hypothetical protein
VSLHEDGLREDGRLQRVDRISVGDRKMVPPAIHYNRACRAYPFIPVNCGPVLVAETGVYFSDTCSTVLTTLTLGSLHGREHADVAV